MAAMYFKSSTRDRNVPTTALLTDRHAKKDNKTSLPPREAQSVDDNVNDGPIVATAP